jgi:hypothetical protein
MPPSVHVADHHAASETSSARPMSAPDRVQVWVSVLGLALAMLGGVAGIVTWYSTRVEDAARTDLEQKQLREGLRELTQEVKALRGEITAVHTQIGELTGMVTIMRAPAPKAVEPDAADVHALP